MYYLLINKWFWKKKTNFNYIDMFSNKIFKPFQKLGHIYKVWRIPGCRCEIVPRTLMFSIRFILNIDVFGLNNDQMT
jgi:hypothetical protein